MDSCCTIGSGAAFYMYQVRIHPKYSSFGVNVGISCAVVLKRKHLRLYRDYLSFENGFGSSELKTSKLLMYAINTMNKRLCHLLTSINSNEKCRVMFIPCLLMLVTFTQNIYDDVFLIVFLSVMCFTQYTISTLIRA